MLQVRVLGVATAGLFTFTIGWYLVCGFVMDFGGQTRTDNGLHCI